jgi:polyphosphate glucokinase
MDILVVDVGGSHLKVLATGQAEERKVVSGPTLTAQEMVDTVKAMTNDWTYDAITMGYPGPVAHDAPLKDPANLGPGWVGFDFATAFGKPTKIVNDAAMQALGSYEGGRMLFLGLGTGLGSAMVIEGIVQPMELAHLQYTRKRTYEGMLGLAAMRRLGKKKWRREVNVILEQLTAALQPDYVILGGGNAKLLTELPANARLGQNTNAFLGGFRLWEQPKNVVQTPVRPKRVKAAE